MTRIGISKVNDVLARRSVLTDLILLIWEQDDASEQESEFDVDGDQRLMKIIDVNSRQPRVLDGGDADEHCGPC
jgi:hypothetical protein